LKEDVIEIKTRGTFTLSELRGGGRGSLPRRKEALKGVSGEGAQVPEHCSKWGNRQIRPKKGGEPSSMGGDISKAR